MSAIEKTLQNWHQHLRGTYEPGLDGLLHEDSVFYSPVVYSPQKGKEITKLYLTAAGNTLGPEDGTALQKEKDPDHIPFHYVKEVASGNTAVLEFEQTLDGKYLNGVDIITCDDEGKIIEFKVIVRPLQAINLLHKKMAAMLEQMKGG